MYGIGNKILQTKLFENPSLIIYFVIHIIFEDLMHKDEKEYDKFSLLQLKTMNFNVHIARGKV